MNIGIIIVALDVALIYIKKYVMLRDSVKGTRVHAAWASLFLGYAMMILFYLLGAMYTSTMHQRYHLLQLGYLSAATGAFFYIYYIEQLPYIAKRRVFTFLFGILYVALIIIIIIAFFADLGTFVQWFAASFWIPNFGFITTYIYKINRMSIGKLRQLSVLVAIGFSTLILGVLGSTDAIQRPFGLGVRFVADILQLAGIVMVGWFSSKLPSWKELEWETALESLYIIYKGGLLAYEYDFNEASQGAGQARTAIAVSALEAVRMLLNQVTKSGELKVVDFKDKKLFFESGKYITVIVVAKQQLDTLGYIISKIRKEIEKAFSDMLPTWSGDSADFAPATTIINRILS
ncbi:MAG: hypothetical protein Q6353_021605 [Candidatus Sigynarchaeum springense]